MSDPQPQPAPPKAIVVLCEECGEVTEVKDPASLIRALHLQNECSVSGLFASHE